MAHTEPLDISDLPAYFDESGDRYRDMRATATTESERAYYLGRMDAFYGAAGMVRGLLGSYAPNGESHDPVRDAETAQAIEALDGYKHRGDTSVTFAGR